MGRTVGRKWQRRKKTGAEGRKRGKGGGRERGMRDRGQERRKTGERKEEDGGMRKCVKKRKRKGPTYVFLNNGSLEGGVQSVHPLIQLAAHTGVKTCIQSRH